MAEPQTEMRMTRARAKAIATPGAGLDTTKAVAKTTGRRPRRTQTDVRPEEDTKPQQLFQDEQQEPAAPQPVATEPAAAAPLPAEPAAAIVEAQEEADEEPAASASEPAEWSSNPSSPESMQAPVPTQQDEQPTPTQPMASLDSAMDSAASEAADVSEDVCESPAVEVAAASPAAQFAQDDVAAAMEDMPDDVSDVVEDEDDQMQEDEAEVQAAAGYDIPAQAEGIEEAVAEISAHADGLDVTAFETVVGQEQIEVAVGMETAEDMPHALAASDGQMCEDGSQPADGASMPASTVIASSIDEAAADSIPADAGFGGFSVVEHPAAASPAVVREAGKTPKTASKTAGKKSVGFGSSSIKFWETKVSVPKTPGVVTSALAGATPASRKTGGTAKRVSISTPQHPKSAGLKAAVVRTPYPKSSEKTNEELEEDEEEEEDAVVPPLALSAEDGMDVDATAAGVSSPAPASAPGSPASEPQPVPSSAEKSAAKPARPNSAAPAEAKYQKAEAALKSLARAEAEASKPAPPAYVRPSTAPIGKSVPGYLMPTAAAKLKSKVVVPEGYDSRSLGQLRREIKEAGDRKQSKQSKALKDYGLEGVRAAPSMIQPVRDSEDLHEDDGEAEAKYDQATEDALVEALGGLAVGKPSGSSKVEPLKGLPLPQGRHIRFTDKGKAKESTAMTLRGLPPAEGKHIRFD